MARTSTADVRMPEAIRIGYRDYEVQSWKSSEASASERYAECDRINQVIRVRDDLPEQLTAECLLHEVLHAAYDMGGIDPGDGEERTVTVMSIQLSQVIRDNPALIAYLQEALAPRPL
jgi:hypothetical protein